MKNIKNIKNILLITLLALAVILPNFINPAQAAPDVKVTVNGQYVTFDQKPFIDKNNRTMVPVRAPMEAIGCTVDWDADKRQAIITKGETKAVFTINSKTYTVNGQNKTMDTQAVIVNSRTAFPIRFAAEAMGATVGWDGNTYTVIITTAPAATGIVEATPEQVVALKAKYDESFWETSRRIDSEYTKSFDQMTAQDKEIAWGLLETGIIKPGQTFVTSKDATFRDGTGRYNVRGYLTLTVNGQTKTYIGKVSGMYENSEYNRVFFESDENVSFAESAYEQTI
ncbi:MAG: copper amine oxidase N-terminal domain-containing protein [Syntrophomonadaceae bacterium]|mgnify:CR=1 FL=1|jgi:hypothetical protein